MTSETHRVYRAAVKASREDRRAVLATIVAARGSTPRGVGSRMLIDLDGVLVGTIGGGCGEGRVIEAAGEVFQTGVPQTVRIDLTEDLFSWSPAVCGGIFDVFVERI